MGAPTRRHTGTEICRTVFAGLSLLSAFLLATVAQSLVLAGEAEAKTPGATYCFHGTCHRVKTLGETRALVGADLTLAASFYDDCKRDRYNPCGLTSSGERFDSSQPDNAASPILPDGTKVLVWSPETGEAAVLRINNAGPYWGNRKLDVSRATAKRLGFSHRGVARLKVRIIEAPTKAEATYRKGRHYEPVRGALGEYAGIDAAAAGLTALASLDTVGSSLLAPVASNALIAADGSMKVSRNLDVAALTSGTAGTADLIQTASLTADANAEFTRVLDSLKDLVVPVALTAVAENTVVAGSGSEDAEPEAAREANVDRAEPKRPAAKSQRVAAARIKPVTSVSERKRVMVSTGAPRLPAAVLKTAEGTNDMSVFSRHNRVADAVTAGRSKFAKKRAQLKGGRPAA